MPRQTRASAGKLSGEKYEPFTPRAQPRIPPSRVRIPPREVKNSSDLSSDNEIASTAPVRVVIPAAHQEISRSARSTASAGTSVHDYSSHEEQETPLTSAAPTPFERSAVTRASSKRSPHADLSNVSKRLSTTSVRSQIAPRGRLKRHNMDLDERLARELQEEEYSGPIKSVSYTSFENLTAKQQRRLDRCGLVDSEDNEDDDEDEDDGSSEEDSASTSAPLKRKLQPRQPQIHQVSKRKRVASASYQRIKHLTRGNAYAMEPHRAHGKIDSGDESDGQDQSVASFASVASDDAGDRSFSLANDDSDSSVLSELPDDPDVSQNEKPSPTVKKKTKAKSNRVITHSHKTGANSSASRPLWRQPDESRSEFERRRLENAHPKCKTLWDDLEQVPVVKPQQIPQPSGINRVLKSFQLEGVNWMRRMETESQWKGGLLGDEMGMGKTIQAVSLIMSDYPAGKPTLVVVPPVALMQWAAEIEAYTDGKLRVLIHHGTNSKVKNLRVKDLMEFDVIMVSYNGLQHMHQKEIKGRKAGDVLVKENSRLHAIQYHRLILDEAHSIKSRTTQIAKSCYALKADFKWCLSGTPVQNRIGEFFSLLRFLEVEPFASYFCKECPCESLHWVQDSSAKCAKCQHTLFNHVSLFNQELLHPITSGDPDERTKAMRKLRLLTDRIMLRRMKRDHVTAMELPPKKVVIHNEFFGPIECDFNKSIMTQSTRQFDTYVARGVELKNYANIFGLIMQMRQVANHPDLILKKRSEGSDKVLVCAVCDEVAEEPIRSQCRHDFCRRCAIDLLGECVSGASADCPTCHIALRIDLDQPEIEQDEDAVRDASIITRINMDNWHSSTKIEALIIELFELRSKKRTAKSIVFSQFTSMLQLLEWRLRRAGFSTVMLDGSMNPNQRQNSIKYFMDNVDVEVFLVSLKAGGVALNLTEASRVFIVDPWWNPAAEWQSADRCHRIGQKRPCQITRLCIEDSVESRMVMLQEKKANLINGTVNGDDVALGKLTAEDLQFLFRGT